MLDYGESSKSGAVNPAFLGRSGVLYSRVDTQGIQRLRFGKPYLQNYGGIYV